MIKPGTILKCAKQLRGAVTAKTIEGGCNGRTIHELIPLGTVVEVIREHDCGLLVWIPQFNIFVDQLPKNWYTK